MAGNYRFTALRIASFIAALGLVGVFWGPSMGWASGHESRGMSPTAQGQPLQRPAPMSGPTATTVLLDRSPQTIDEYAAHVQNRLQAAAMDLRQQGTAELRLTIGKDGSIRETEIVELDGPAALREQVRPLVSQIAPLPALPGDVDVLVVRTDLAFDYPGENLMDSFGRLAGFPG
jgi:outer membrane biosynthesis protein TonB